MLTLKDVTKEFRLDDQTVVTPVRDANLEVESGEFLMIVGRSGSGKTTLLNLCAGFIKPTAGHVLVDGKDLQDLDEKAVSELRSQKIGFVFQTASMLPSLTVIENVAVPTMFGGEGTKEELLGRARKVLGMVGLGERMDVLPRQLSGGENRRVAIARALMNEPEILIADEPTSDLDVQTELMIVALLQTIQQSGVTILMVTHSMELIPYASRALRMENGVLAPLEGEMEAASLPLSVEAAPVVRRATGKRTGFWAGLGGWLRRPAHAALVGLGIAIVAILVALGIVLASLDGNNTTAAAGTTTGPGPALGGMNSTGNGGTYDPSEYSLYGNTGMYTSAMMGVNWPLKIDPAPGDDFKDLPVLENTSGKDGVFQGKLEAKVAEVTLGGAKAKLLTYNGSYPGPILKVKRGDTLKIEFVNSLPATTEKNVLGYEKNHSNLHTHGLHVTPKEPGDNVMVDVAPGGSYNYEYDLSKTYAGTLEFIHPHVHGSAAEQLWGGLLAPVLVEDETPALAGYESHVMVLKDITLAGDEPQAHLFMSDYMYGKEGNIVTVNGQVNPVLSLKPGQVQRWRVLNGSNARFYRIYLENHLLYLVGTDGGPLDKPYPVSTLILAPGERADILVKATGSEGTFKFVSLPYSRMMCGMGSGMMGMSMVDQTQTQIPGYNSMGMMGGMDMMGMMGGTGTMGSMGSTNGMSMGNMNMYTAQGGAPYAYWPVVTNALGMTTLEIMNQLAQGKSLVDIAQAKGVTQEALNKVVLDQLKAGLDQYVNAGYLTRAQADQQLQTLSPLALQALSTKGWSGYMNSSTNSSTYDPYGTNGSSCGSTGTSGMSGMNGTSAQGMCPGMIGTIGMGAYDLSAAAQVTLMTVTTKGTPVSDSLPTVIDAGSKRLNMDLTNLPKRTITMAMDMGNGYINGQDFDVAPYTITSKLGTYEVWQIVNQSCMDHPFHLHLNAFQVLSLVGGDSDYARIYTTTPAMKDTVIVPAMGTATILVPIEDFEGMAMFHCHILEHEDIGMMGQWQIGAAGTDGAGKSGGSGTNGATTTTSMPTM